MYLGLDQSLQSTGVVVLDAEHHEPIFLHAVKTGKARAVERLSLIRDVVRHVIEEYQPTFAALEGYSYGSVGRVFELGELGGVLRLCLSDLKVKFVVVPPASLKLFVTTDGSASKEKMKLTTSKKWGVDLDQDDICDAYGLAQIARAYHRQDTTIRVELEVIKSLSAKEPALPLISSGRTKIST